MAIDYGLARTGVALTDPSGVIAYPLTVIRERTLSVLAERLLAIIAEYSVDAVIVGYPTAMADAQGAVPKGVRMLCGLLRDESACPVELVDERGSSAAAHEMMKQNGVKYSARKKILDAVAATVLLEWHNAGK